MKTLDPKSLVATGIVTWSSEERQSNRYGSIAIVGKSYDGSGSYTPILHPRRLSRLYGNRVHLNCRVLESRDSGHIGDHFLNIMPSRPEVGEVISLGVGFLTKEKVSWSNDLVLALKPRDSRSKFWIDPRKLYRLHDQTVEVYAEPTSLPFSEVPDIAPIHGEGIINLGDGSIQQSGVEFNKKYSIPMNVESLGDGLFIVSPPQDKFIPLNKLKKVNE